MLPRETCNVDVWIVSGLFVVGGVVLVGDVLLISNSSDVFRINDNKIQLTMTIEMKHMSGPELIRPESLFFRFFHDPLHPRCFPTLDPRPSVAAAGAHCARCCERRFHSW